MLQTDIIVSFLLLTLVSSSPILDSTVRLEWEAWKGTHGKTYSHSLEEQERLVVWMKNKEMIDAHNADVDGYTLAMNEFGDVTDEEWRESYLGYLPPVNYSDLGIKVTTFKPVSNDFPADLDWRNKNVVTPVKTQLQCNSSYAFSATGALEGASAMVTTGMPHPFSEQNIVDCTIPYGNHGCQGGSQYNTYKYIISQGGVERAIDYPFTGKQGRCYYDKPASGSEMSGVVRIASGSESDLLAAVATVGPVAVNVDATSSTFRFYSGGVFDSVYCSNNRLNHGMLITGYGTVNNRKYWLVKNSWGKSWGEGGYIKMMRDSYNQCGIATDALYPTL